jgi:hypothetical protein
MKDKFIKLIILLSISYKYHLIKKRILIGTNKGKP